MKNKLTLGIKFVILVVMLFIFGSVSLQVEAKELNQTGFVDSIDMSVKYLQVNENSLLTIDVSEKPDNKLEEGDVLTLLAPPNMKFTKYDLSAPLELKEGGIVYATAVTNSDDSQMIVTFNENVAMKSNFKGSLNLTVQAGWVDPGEVNVKEEKHFQTNLGTTLPMIDYTIWNMKTEGTNPYFYKTDGMVWSSNKDYVYWWLNINRDMLTSTVDIEIKDRLKPGQTLVKLDASIPISLDNIDNANFVIKVYGNGNEINPIETLTSKAFVDKGYGSINFIDDTSFDIAIDKTALAGRYIVIEYRTRITPEGKYQDYFYNDAYTNYIDPKTGKLVEAINKSAKNLLNDATIAPEKGKLRIIKLAKDGEEVKVLPNTSFKIFKADGSEVDYIGNNVLTTDASGQVDTPTLNNGSYYITEISAPDFVDFDRDKQYPFTISASDTKGVVLVISNELKTIDIPVEKIWKGSSEEHPTIKINLLANNKVIDSVELVSGQTTHTFTKLPLTDLSGNPIEYEVSEENVPGYISEVTGTVENGFTVTNSPKGEFIATKEASEQVLKPGEKFTYTITVTNTVEGSILKNLLVEDNMPDGIQIDGNLRLNGEAVDEIIGNGFKVTIPELKGNEIATIKVDAVVKEDASESKPVNIAKITDPEDPDNPKEPPAEVEIIRETDLRLLKTGMDGKTVLKDAVFDLYQLVEGKEEFLLSYTTDNVGHINFTKLKSGTYIIKEKIAPNGYQLLEESITLTIDKKGILSLVDSLKGMVSLDKVANEFQLTIKNEEEPTKGILPQTGGNGHLGYTKTALLLMIIGSSLFGYYWYRSRKGWQS